MDFYLRRQGAFPCFDVAIESDSCRVFLMTVAELIASREPEWRELEELAIELQKPRFRRRTPPETIVRFTSLYRAVCSDLALAESYQLPPATVSRLNGLVAKAHNCLYRQKGGRGVSFRDLVFFEAPRWILTDVMFWVAFILFWGCYLTSEYMARHDPNFAADVVGQGVIESMLDMYGHDFETTFYERLPALAHYVSNNGGIGLKTFCFGILGVIPGLFVLLSNSIFIGSVAGYMTGPLCPPATVMRFSEFTLAHGPFELTAIVLSAAAGMRMGFGLVMTKGYTRGESLRRATIKAAPAIFVGFVLFCLAACIEAFVSPNPMNWLDGTFLDSLTIKKCVHWFSIAVLLGYFVLLGGFSIWRRYRGLSLRSAASRFWRASLDNETSRAVIDASPSEKLEVDSVPERAL